MSRGKRIDDATRRRAKDLRAAGQTVVDTARELRISPRSVKSFSRAPRPPGAPDPPGDGAEDELCQDLAPGVETEDGPVVEAPSEYELPPLPTRPLPPALPELTKARPDARLESALSARAAAHAEQDVEELDDYRREKLRIERLRAEAELAREKRQVLEGELAVLRGQLLVRQSDSPQEPADDGLGQALVTEVNQLREQLRSKELEVLEGKFNAQVSELRAAQNPAGRTEWDIMALGITRLSDLVGELGRDLRAYALGQMAKQDLAPGHRTTEERDLLGRQLVGRLEGKPQVTPMVLRASRTTVTCQSCASSFAVDVAALKLEAAGGSGYLKCPACSFLLDAFPLLGQAGSAQKGNGQDDQKAWAACPDYSPRAVEFGCNPSGYPEPKCASCPAFKA